MRQVPIVPKTADSRFQRQGRGRGTLRLQGDPFRALVVAVAVAASSLTTGSTPAAASGAGASVPAAAWTAPSSSEDEAQNGRLVFDGWPGACFAHEECFGSMAPQYDIWSANPDGTGLTNLTNAPGVDAGGQWSPDGSKIAFTSNRDGDYDIFVMNADGSDLKQLTRAPGSERYPTWAPNGRRIAFVSDSRGADDVVIATADGTVRRRIRNSAGAAWLAWSPDGRHIAYSRVIRDDPAHSEAGDQWDVFLVRRDGTGFRRLTSRYDGLVSYSANWAPHGRRLVFDGVRCDNRHDSATCDDMAIFTIRRDGRGLRQIATGSWVDAPEWSPDGMTITYTSEEGDSAGGGDLWFVDPDGSNARHVIIKPDTYDFQVDWQPVPGE